MGGVSALDLPRLEISSLEEAESFIHTYGYDLKNPRHEERLWMTHRRAIAFLRDHLMEPSEEIPELLTDPAQLKNLAYLLVYASTQQSSENALQKWSCAILRIMHVYSHLENDLFSFFSEEIQTQVLRPLQTHIIRDPGSDSVTLGSPNQEEHIRLQKFEVKPFKTTSSSIIKVLAKREAINLTLLDKLGVRFVTRGIFDSFRVIRYLFEKHLVSFPHLIPDQSNNTLYPVNLFLELMEQMIQGASQPKTEEIQASLERHLAAAKSRAEYREKPNLYTDKDYRFIKFINRKLIEVTMSENGDKLFSFFYPYEIQIMDYETYLKHLSGPSAHDQYKDRQRKAARLRVLGAN